MTVSRKKFPECPIERAIAVLSGRWKARVLWQLAGSPRRYSQLLDLLDGVSQRTLTFALRELEEDGVIRKDSGVWSMTSLGERLIPSLENMFSWGTEHSIKLPDR